MAASSGGRLAGKVGVVFGFASERSLAWGLAQAWQREGARVAIGIQSDRFQGRLAKLTEGWGARPPHIFTCDVRDDAAIAAAFGGISGAFDTPHVHMVGHSVAYASKAAMHDPLLECSREDFNQAMDISAFSLLAVSKHAVPLMPPTGGSIMCMSYIGAARVVPDYKVMGPVKAALEALARQLAVELGPRKIRVNTISAGPVETLAARGIANFSALSQEAAAAAPLQRGVTTADVGNLGVFLAADESSGITGQTLYVDAGYSALL